MSENVIKNKLELYLLSILAILVLPLSYFRYTIDPVITIRLFFLTLILLCIDIIIFIRFNQYKRFTSIFRRYIFVFFLGYVILSALSIIKAINIIESIISIEKIIAGLILFISATIILNINKENIFVLCKIATISSFIVAGIGLLQHLFGLLDYLPGVDVVYSTFVNRNLFSSALFLLLPFSLFCYFAFKKFWPVIAYLAIGFSFYLILVIKTRAVWLGLFSAFILTVLSILIHKDYKIFKKLSSKFKLLLLVFTIIVIILITLVNINSAKKSSYMSRKKVTSYSGLKVRLQAWEKTIPMITENPLLGVGVGNWKIVLPKYGVTGMKTERGAYQYIRPHNDFIWVLAETGIISFLLFVAIFGTAIYYLLMVIKKRKYTNEKLLCYLLLFGLIGYMVISCFSFPKERIFHLIILIIILACSTVIYHKKFPTKKGINNKIIIIILVFIILLLAAMNYYNYHRLKSEMHLFFGLQAQRIGDVWTEIAAISRIDTRIYNMSPTGIPTLWYRGIAYYDTNQINKAFTDFKAAYGNHPYHIYIINNLASCYEMKGEHQKAIEYYKKALEISPNFEEAIINLSAVYYNIQEYEKAKEVIDRCDSEKDYPRYKQYKEQIEKKLQAGEK